MPIKIQNDLPARGLLEEENIFVMDENRAINQAIRPLRVGILNLMPLKEDTELQLLRSFSNTPLQVDLTFITMTDHECKNTSAKHINKFYETFQSVKKRRFDGLIITGAPVEHLAFEEVDYWEELKEVFAWSETHVTSTLHICWGAQAALYYHYGLEKTLLPKKLFGVYQHKVKHRREPLVRGFDDYFVAPHSRHTTVSRDAIANCPALKIMAESVEAGVFICMAENGKKIFVMGHPEYDRMTLDREYRRDVAKGLEIEVPKNYYPNDDPEQRPALQWRAHANTLYTNWLNYYVYQITPYIWEDEK